jgi:hypothetical protein
MTDLSWVPAMITAFQQHHPWIIDKVGGALVSQPVKELWEQVKKKLGHTAIEKIEAQPDDAAQWELFKARLLVALDEDPVFQEKLHGLAERVISQQATGNDIQQVAVSNSKKVNISVK